MIYENKDEISLGIGEYIGIEVYKNKILLTQEGHSVEYVVNDLSEDIKKIFNELNFDDWRMYGIADFNYAKNTFLKNVSDKEVLMKLFIPRTDIRILKDSLEIKTIDNFDEIILNFDTEHFDLEDKDFNVNLEEVKNNEYILTPGRYVGLADVEEDEEPFEQKMERITSELSEQFAKSKELEDQIRKSLEGLGYGV